MVPESDWPLAEGVVVVVKGVVRPPVAVAQLEEVSPRLCEVCSTSACGFDTSEGACPLFDVGGYPQLNSYYYKVDGPLAH